MNRKYGGKELAKVLVYFGLMGPDVMSTEFNIVCPFHDDVNPSMHISLSDGSFFCFGCEARGNALDFVRKVYPQVTELQACVLTEQILRSKEVQEIKVSHRKKKKQNSKQSIEEAKGYFYGLRETDWNKVETKQAKEVLEYMSDRGFDARALNVARCRMNEYNVAYPFLFPILDNGVFMGWVGRTMNKYTERKRKYLYNDGFRKRDTLCGNYAEGKKVYICEGYMDYLSFRVRGRVKNVVAILGWHISDEQVAKLKRKNITTVISALDNDDKGRKGTEYLKKFFEVIPFCYPEGVKDAGEMSAEEIERAKRKTRKSYYESKRNN